MNDGMNELLQKNRGDENGVKFKNADLKNVSICVWI